ncbi:unnamed protein product [Boreogadus saida]
MNMQPYLTVAQQPNLAARWQTAILWGSVSRSLAIQGPLPGRGPGHLEPRGAGAETMALQRQPAEHRLRRRVMPNTGL